MEKVVENIIVVHEEKATDIQESNTQSQQGKAITAISFIKCLNNISFCYLPNQIRHLFRCCIYSVAVNP